MTLDGDAVTGELETADGQEDQEEAAIDEPATTADLSDDHDLAPPEAELAVEDGEEEVGEAGEVTSDQLTVEESLTNISTLEVHLPAGNTVPLPYSSNNFVFLYSVRPFSQHCYRTSLILCSYCVLVISESKYRKPPPYYFCPDTGAGMHLILLTPVFCNSC